MSVEPPRIGTRLTLLVFGGGLLVGGLVAFFMLQPSRFAPRSSPASSTPQAPASLTVSNTETAPAYNPEIPINEYWDYALIGDLHIYVNNTDRNVVYALGPTGKIVWTFWAKDYGFNGYEIRHNDRYFFLSGYAKDALGNIFAPLAVLGVDGRLRWLHLFDGGLDMPAMLITNSNALIIDNYDNGQCDRGCGVLCSNKKSSDDYCRNNALWAFDLETGRVLWKNATRSFYFGRQSELPDGDLESRSGGIGPGRWVHTYVVSSTTGLITAHRAIVSDREYGQDRKQLHLDENAKTIFLTDYSSTTTHWTVHAPDPLYELIQDKGQKTGLQIYILNDIILANLGQDNNWTTYGIDKSNGRILWQQDFDSAHWGSFYWRTDDGVLLFIQTFRSACEEICRTCPKNSWICADVPSLPECKVCQAKEQGTPGYTAARVMAVDAHTGAQLWKYGAGKSWMQFDDRIQGQSVSSTVDVNSYENNTSTRRTFDIHSGEVLKLQFGNSR